MSVNESSILFSVTGSCGKTTCVHLIYFLLKSFYPDLRIGLSATSVSKYYDRGEEQIVYEYYGESQ